MGTAIVAGEGIDMTPQLYDNTVLISTVPGNASRFYAGKGDGVVWALDAATGDQQQRCTVTTTTHTIRRRQCNSIIERTSCSQRYRVRE
jgi:hypothetical protein